MFTAIKLGQLAKQGFVTTTRTVFCESFLKILWDEGFIIGYKIESTTNQLKIFLKYNNGKPVINSLKFLSKPGHRIYYSIKQIWKIDSGKYFIIFSTTKGLKTILECKKLKIGGEPCVILN